MTLLLGNHCHRESTVVTDKKTYELADAIQRDMEKLKLNAAQIFTHGPVAVKETKYDAEKIKTYVTKNNINLTVHSAYMTTGIWGIDIKDPSSTKFKYNVGNVARQLAAAEKIGAWGLVIHITKKPPKVIASITKKILHPYVRKYNVKILLEMTAKCADDDLTYETPEKLNNLEKMLQITDKTTNTKKYIPYWGFTIDTAHIWAAGVDIKSYDSMRKWLADIDNPKCILQFHLNGSSAKLGSGKDKHEIPFGPDDLIWRDVEPKESGLCAIIEFAVKHHISVICEINRGDPADFKKAVATIKKLTE